MSTLSILDHIILDKLQENPFNITRISRDLEISCYKLKRRIKILLEEKSIKIYAEPVLPKLGLTLMLFILNGRSNTNIDMRVPYGMSKWRLLKNTTMLTYAIPRKFVKNLLKFIKIVYGRDSILLYKVYDEMVVEKKDFRLIKDLTYFSRLMSLKDLEGELDLEGHRREDFDKQDLLIIRELQKDATTKIVNIANKLGVSKQLVSYHLRKHILPRGLIKFNARISKSFEDNLTYHFLIDFDNPLNAIIFSKNIARSPYTSSVFLSGSSIFMPGLRMPTEIFLKLLQTLDKFVMDGIVIRYEHYIQDPYSLPIKRTIQCRTYRKGKWLPDELLLAVNKGEVEVIKQNEESMGNREISEKHRYLRI